MMIHRASRYTLAIGFVLVPAFAGAQAFGLNEIGACAIARGFAVTGAPCADASSIYWNPGALPLRQGLTASAGATIIAISGDFTRDSTHQVFDSDVSASLVPDFFAIYRKGKLGYGLGVYVPYGLTSQWGSDFPGRFSAQKAALHTVYIQPNIGYAINKDWSVGGGLVIGHSTVELVQALDLSSQAAPGAPPGVTFGNLGIAKYTEFGRAKLNGTAMAYGVHLGFHGNITSDWQVGGRFLSQLVFSYDNADATFTQTPTNLVLAQGNVIVPNGASAPVDPLLATQFAPGGPLTAQGVTTEIAHPAQVQVGAAYTGFRHTTLSADYSWVGWRSFQSLPVNFLGPAKSSSRVLEEDYNNTSSIRLGVEYRLATGFGFRGGFAAAASAAPAETVTPLLPEMDRQLGMFGVSVPLWQRQWTFDASYAHVFTPGSRGRLDERVNGSTQAAALALNNGAYTLSANIWSFGLVYAH